VWISRWFHFGNNNLRKNGYPYSLQGIRAFLGVNEFIQRHKIVDLQDKHLHSSPKLILTIARRCSIKTMWDLWLKGRIAESIAPYRLLNSFDLSVKSDAPLLSEARRVMETIADCAEPLHGSRPTILRISDCDFLRLIISFKQVHMNYSSFFTLKMHWNHLIDEWLVA
jgi:hypothetical protein